MADMMKHKPVKPSLCPTCREPVPPRSENKEFPFCNARCRLIDLGRWLNEEYKIPEPELRLPPAGEDENG